MDLEIKYKEIIPPKDYQHRKDFNNEYLIDELSIQEKKEVEELLINDLDSSLGVDLLVIETLAYLKSEKSINIIREKLNDSKESYDKIIIARCLFNLGEKKDLMIKIAYESFLTIKDDYAKTYLFYILAKFNSEKINNLIKTYTTSTNILLAHNSKMALGIG